MNNEKLAKKNKLYLFINYIELILNIFSTKDI